MNKLREAVHEYLNLRRGLGFKMQEAGKGLLDFATFMEQNRATGSRLGPAALERPTCKLGQTPWACPWICSASRSD